VPNSAFLLAVNRIVDSIATALFFFFFLMLRFCHMFVQHWLMLVWELVRGLRNSGLKYSHGKQRLGSLRQFDDLLWVPVIDLAEGQLCSTV
jgi:hypothetical protein